MAKSDSHRKPSSWKTLSSNLNSLVNVAGTTVAETTQNLINRAQISPVSALISRSSRFRGIKPVIWASSTEPELHICYLLQQTFADCSSSKLQLSLVIQVSSISNTWFIVTVTQSQFWSTVFVGTLHYTACYLGLSTTCWLLCHLWYVWDKPNNDHFIGKQLWSRGIGR